MNKLFGLMCQELLMMVLDKRFLLRSALDCVSGWCQEKPSQEAVACRKASNPHISTAHMSTFRLSVPFRCRCSSLMTSKAWGQNHNCCGCKAVSIMALTHGWGSSQPLVLHEQLLLVRLQDSHEPRSRCCAGQKPSGTHFDAL